MKELKITTLLLLIVLIIQSCSQAANWNQYLGPDRNAMIAGPEIARSWSDKQPKELWSHPLGEGYGGAAVFGEEVFILDREKGKSDIMRCFDLLTGEEKWTYSYEAEGEIPFPGSRTVPTVDKKYVWSVGPHGDIYCFDKESHQPVWNHNLLEDFNRELSTWGVSQAPLIYGDLVIVAPQGSMAGVVAYHKHSGDLVWQTRPLSGHPFHASPALMSFGGTDQVIVLSPYERKDSTKTHEVVSFDATSGEELWTYKGLKSFATITPAVQIDDHSLFLTDCSFDGGYDPVSILLDISKAEDTYVIKEVFLTEKAGSKMHPAVLYKDHLYLNHTGNPNQMMCMNLQGETIWEDGSAPGFELGALILVNGLIINQNGKNGDVHLIEPTPAGYKELGKASYFTSKKSQAWAPPAYSQGKLLIRDLEKLVCVDLQNLVDR
jgi:outer membrane protein assembly factor BamB